VKWPFIVRLFAAARRALTLRLEIVAGEPGHGPLQWLRREVRIPTPRLRAEKGRVN
jgi:hypothetical protein